MLQVFISYGMHYWLQRISVGAHKDDDPQTATDGFHSREGPSGGANLCTAGQSSGSAIDESEAASKIDLTLLNYNPIPENACDFIYRSTI